MNNQYEQKKAKTTPNLELLNFIKNSYQYLKERKENISSEQNQPPITLTQELMDYIKEDVFQSFASTMERFNENESFRDWNRWHLLFGFTAGVINTYKRTRDLMTDNPGIAKGLDIQFVAEVAQSLGFDEIAVYAFEIAGQNNRPLNRGTYNG